MSLLTFFFHCMLLSSSLCVCESLFPECVNDLIFSHSLNKNRQLYHIQNHIYIYSVLFVVQDTVLERVLHILDILFTASWPRHYFIQIPQLANITAINLNGRKKKNVCHVLRISKL